MNALIVEDNDDTRRLFEFQLESFGYKVTSCITAESALIAYRQDFYQIILLDLGLPGMDGLEFCRRIRALTGYEQSMIVVITAYDSMEVLEAALDAGADEYLVKPVKWDALKMRFRIIEQHLYNRIQRKQAERAFRESEETARALLNAPTDAVMLITPQGVVLEVNRTAACQFGTSIEQLIGSSVWEAFPSDFTERTKIRVEEVVQTGEVFRGEDTWQNMWFDIVIYPIFDIKGSVGKLAIIARNITERKRIEDKCVKRQKHLEDLVKERTEKITRLSEQLQQEIAERQQIEQALRLSKGQCQLLAQNVSNGTSATQNMANSRDVAERKGTERFEEIIGKSPIMQNIYDLILQASGSDFTVMIYGESGTGKELISRLSFAPSMYTAAAPRM